MYGRTHQFIHLDGVWGTRECPKWGWQVCPGSSRSPTVSTFVEYDEGKQLTFQVHSCIPDSPQLSLYFGRFYWSYFTNPNSSIETDLYQLCWDRFINIMENSMDGFRRENFHHILLHSMILFIEKLCKILSCRKLEPWVFGRE